MAADPHFRQPQDILETGNNIIEISESCEDSRALVGKLQARYGKTSRYYPPKTQPDNKYERRIGDVHFARPLSPIQEKCRSYKPSFNRISRIPQYETCEPWHFRTATSQGSSVFNGKLDYSPSSTPMKQNPPAFEFAKPPLTSVKMGRDMFTPEPPLYRSAYTPSNPTSPSYLPYAPLKPQESPYPYSDRNCSFGDISRDAYPLPSSQQIMPESRNHAPSPACRLPCSDSERNCLVGGISDTIDASRDLKSGRVSPERRGRSPSPALRSPCSKSDEKCSPDEVRNMITSRGTVSSSHPMSGASHEKKGRSSNPSRRPPCLDSDRSYLLDVVSEMIEFSSTVPSRRKCRQANPEGRDCAASPTCMSPRPDSNRNCSFDDTSDVIALSRGMETSHIATPDLQRGISNVNRNVLAILTPSTPIPADFSDDALNRSLVKLEYLELEEMRCIQEKIKTFQEARRELVLSIMSLQEVDVSP